MYLSYALYVYMHVANAKKTVWICSQSHVNPIQRQSQDFGLEGTKLKDNIKNNNKKFINLY